MFVLFRSSKKGAVTDIGETPQLALTEEERSILYYFRRVALIEEERIAVSSFGATIEWSRFESSVISVFEVDRRLMQRWLIEEEPE